MSLKAARLISFAPSRGLYIAFRSSRPFCQSLKSFSTTYTKMSQADISKSNPIAVDGSFKRADASFRNHVTKGGEFAPEAGMKS
jgi:hypothetical protein